MKITLVKKILADGSPCKKCGDIMKKLEDGDQLKYIDEILIADERNPESPGMLIAAKYQVNRAPFFILDEPEQDVKIYTVYFKFVKEVLDQKISEKEELKEIMNDNPDLDFI